jgi:murein L,D-transpeptidase YafK
MILRRNIPTGLLFVLFLTCIGKADDPLANNARADKVLVPKSERTLQFLDHSKVLKQSKIALGGKPVGKKDRQGDHKTPEGTYILDRRNEHSQFYRSLHISYPNAEDRQRAQQSGLMPGGDIMIHGLPNGFGWLGSTTDSAIGRTAA